MRRGACRTTASESMTHTRRRVATLQEQVREADRKTRAIRQQLVWAERELHAEEANVIQTDHLYRARSGRIALVALLGDPVNFDHVAALTSVSLCASDGSHLWPQTSEDFHNLDISSVASRWKDGAGTHLKVTYAKSNKERRIAVDKVYVEVADGNRPLPPRVTVGEYATLHQISGSAPDSLLDLMVTDAFEFTQFSGLEALRAGRDWFKLAETPVRTLFEHVRPGPSNLYGMARMNGAHEFDQLSEIAVYSGTPVRLLRDA